MYFPIYVDKDKLTISIKRNHKNEIELFPKTSGEDMCWNWSKEKIEKDKNELLVYKNRENINIYKKQRPELNELNVINKKSKKGL